MTTIAVNAELGRFEITRFDDAGSLLGGVEFATLVSASLDVIHPDVQVALTWPKDAAACTSLNTELMRLADGLNRTVWVPQPQGAAFVLPGFGEFAAVDEVGAPSRWRAYPSRLTRTGPHYGTDLDGRLAPLGEVSGARFPGVSFVSVPAHQLEHLRPWYAAIAPTRACSRSTSRCWPTVASASCWPTAAVVGGAARAAGAAARGGLGRRGSAAARPTAGRGCEHRHRPRAHLATGSRATCGCPRPLGRRVGRGRERHLVAADGPEAPRRRRSATAPLSRPGADHAAAARWRWRRGRSRIGRSPRGRPPEPYGRFGRRRRGLRRRSPSPRQVDTDRPGPVILVAGSRAPARRTGCPGCRPHRWSTARPMDLYLWTPLATDQIEGWGLPSADLFLLAGQDPLRLAGRRDRLPAAGAHAGTRRRRPARARQARAGRGAAAAARHRQHPPAAAGVADRISGSPPGSTWTGGRRAVPRRCRRG